MAQINFMLVRYLRGITLMVLFLFITKYSRSQHTAKFYIRTHDDLVTYLNNKDTSMNIYLHHELSYDSLFNILKYNPNKGYVKSLEILGKYSDYVPTFYLDLSGYENLKSLDLRGYRYDTFNVHSLRHIFNLKYLTIRDSDFKNYEEIMNYLVQHDSLSYLSLDSRNIDTILFPDPPIQSLATYYINGNFKYIPQRGINYNNLVDVTFRTSQKIEFIPPSVIESYKSAPRLKFNASFQLDVPIPIQKYLEQMYGQPIKFFSDNTTEYCECFETEIRKCGKKFRRKKFRKTKREMYY